MYHLEGATYRIVLVGHVEALVIDAVGGGHGEQTAHGVEGAQLFYAGGVLTVDGFGIQVVAILRYIRGPEVGALGHNGDDAVEGIVGPSDVAVGDAVEGIGAVAVEVVGVGVGDAD